MARKKKVVEEKIEEKEIIEEPKVEEKPIEIEKVEVPEFYVTKIGETLVDVAKKFSIEVDKLKELNDDPTIVGGNQIRLK